MPGFLDNLSELGANINAPMAADPNLNLAGLLLGAGMLQPTQPGSTPGAVFGNALTNSLGFLVKQRGEQAKLAQEKGLKEQEIGAYNLRTGKEVTGIEAKSAQDQRQFELATEQRRQQHEETMVRLDKQYQLALGAQKGDKLRDKANVGKLGLDFASTYIEQNPEQFAGPDKKTPDARAIQAFRTLQQNRMLRTFGHEPQDYLPYGPQDVQDLAGLALTNPQRYQLLLGDRALIFGDKYVQEVNEAVMKGPTASAKAAPGTKTEPATTGVRQSEPVTGGGEYGPAEREGVRKSKLRDTQDKIKLLETSLQSGTQYGSPITASQKTKIQQQIDLLKSQLEALSGQSQ